MNKNEKVNQKETIHRCKYRMKEGINDGKNLKKQFQEYISIHHPYLKYETIAQPIKIEEIQEMQTEQNKISINTDEQYVTQQELKEQFIKYSLTNVYKNIIYAFQKHISELKDEKLSEIYEGLTPDKWKLAYIQLRVYQNFKNCARFNLKMKNLIKSKNLKCVFLYFLQNAKELWIDNSKLKDKALHLEAIQILIQIYKFPDFIKEIGFYKKSKKDS